jgi:hypothetical protein
LIHKELGLGARISFRVRSYCSVRLGLSLGFGVRFLNGTELCVPTRLVIRDCVCVWVGARMCVCACVCACVHSFVYVDHEIGNLSYWMFSQSESLTEDKQQNNSVFK